MEEKSFFVRFLNEKFETHYIKTSETAQIHLKRLMNLSCLFGLDTETCGRFGKHPDEGLSPILGKVRLIQIFDGGRSYLFDLNYLDSSVLEEFLKTKKFIAHNALFDLGMLQGSGFIVPEIGCTLLASRILMHERYAKDFGLSVSLRAMVELLYKDDVLKVLQNSDWSKPNLTFEQLQYAALDAVCTLKIAEKVGRKIISKKLDRIYGLYRKSQHPISEMEFNGIGFDIEAHRHFMELSRVRMFAARKKVLDITGIESITPHSISAWLRTKLADGTISHWPATKTGKLSTSQGTFEEFSHLDIVAPILEFNEQAKLLSTFGPKLLTFVNPVTKRLHTRYNIAGARTGRLSCNKPNIQQMPREKEFRNLFIPARGNVLVCADFNQIEVRVAAEISGDEAMKKIYRRGADIYKETAAKILKKPLVSITKGERQCAKAIILGSQFGLGAKKFSRYAKANYGVTDIDEEKAEEFIEAYRETYPVFRQWQIDQTKACEKSLKATTVLGKTRALEKDNYYGQALNHPIQGTAAEIILAALVTFHKRKEKSSLLVACVHDEILVEAPEEKAEEVSALLSSCMVEGFREIFPYGVLTGLVEVKTGHAWGEAK